MNHPSSRIRILLGSLLALMALLTGSLALVGAQESELPAFVLELTDEGMVLPETVEAGLTAVSLVNSVEMAPLVVIMGRLNEDVTMDDLMAAMMEGGPEGMVPLVSLVGGSSIMPGASVEATLDFKAGQYIALNFAAEVPDIATFVVEEAAEASEVEAPEADVTIALVDFAFGMPLEIEAGPHLWMIENLGMQWHEVFIIKVEEGVTLDDLMPLLMAQTEGPPDGSQPESEEAPPFQEVFFWMPMGVDERAWMTLDLEPGSYMALCFLPDFVSGEGSHLEHGMVQAFTVVEKAMDY